MASTVSFKQKQTRPEITTEALSSFTCTWNSNSFVPIVKPTLEIPWILENPRRDLHPARSLVPGLLPSWGHIPRTHQPLTHSFLWLRKKAHLKPVLSSGNLWRASQRQLSRAWLLLFPQEGGFTSDFIPKHFRKGTSFSYWQIFSGCYIRRTVIQQLCDPRHATWLLWVWTSLIYKMWRCYLSLVLPNSSSCWEV